MNRRQIVTETLKHNRCDVVPHNIDFTTDMREKLRQHMGLRTPDEVARAVGNYCVQLNVGSVTGPSEGIIQEIYPKPIGEHTYVDDWGVIWKREPGDDIGVVIGPPLKEPTLKGFDAPEPAGRAKYLASFCADGDDRFRLAALTSPIFQRAWFLRGFEDFLMDLVLNKGFVHELLDVIMEYTVKVVREALEYDIDAFFLMDDWGQQQGLLMSPEMWREFIKPRMRRLCDMVKDRNVFLFFHSCGDVECLIPEIIEMGIDVLNPFQPEMMDVFEIKRKYGDRLCFYGGISTQYLLPYGTVDETRSDVRAAADVLGENGGYILAPAHAVQADVPLENVLALVDVMKNQ